MEFLLAVLFLLAVIDFCLWRPQEDYMTASYGTIGIIGEGSPILVHYADEGVIIQDERPTRS